MKALAIVALAVALEAGFLLSVLLPVGPASRPVATGPASAAAAECTCPQPGHS
jgi:hypothetical protein